MKSQRLSQESLAAIENQHPFTWILTVSCSASILNWCDARPDLELGTGVYRLVQFLRMGIVVIDRLPESPDTMWLKMLGNKESARKAFEAIGQLSSSRREKNDIIRTSLKYCVYLRGLPTESLTTEEQEFMRTMEEVDAWLEAEIAEAEQKAEERKQQEIALKMLRKNMSLETIAELTELSIEQLQILRSQPGNN